MSIREIPGVTVHAKEQVWGRYGHCPTASEWMAAVAAILDRTALLMGVVNLNGREKWRVTIGPLPEVDVIWAPDCAMIITVLPPGGSHFHPGRQRQREQRAKGFAYGRPEPRRGRIDMGDDA